LPGWSKAEHGTQKGVMIDSSSAFGIVDLLKDGDSSVYHYKVAQKSKGGPWQLQKAWRSDQNGHTIKEYPLP
jgi:hypothetical protein